MEQVIAAAAVAAVGASIAAVATWRVAMQRSSGRIGTSDAATLWQASEQMRRELRDEVVALRAQAVVLLEKIDRLEARLAQRASDLEDASNE